MGSQSGRPNIALASKGGPSLTPPPLLTSFLPLPQARFRGLFSHGNECCCLLCTYVHITTIGAIKRQEDVRCMGRPSPMSSPAPYQALYVAIGGAASGVAFSASKPLEPITNAPHRMASWNLRSTVEYRSSVVFRGAASPLFVCPSCGPLSSLSSAAAARRTERTNAKCIDDRENDTLSQRIVLPIVHGTRCCWLPYPFALVLARALCVPQQCGLWLTQSLGLDGPFGRDVFDSDAHELFTSCILPTTYAPDHCCPFQVVGVL